MNYLEPTEICQYHKEDKVVKIIGAMMCVNTI